MCSFSRTIGFMLGRSTTKDFRLVRRLMDRYRERKRNLHLVFIDLKRPTTVSRKDFGNVWCPKVYQWLTLGRKGHV